MKFITLFAMLLATNVYASEPSCSKQQGEEEVKDKLEIKTDVPSHLKGATITVTLADGSSSTVPAEKFKVVARKQQFIVTRVERSTVTSCTTNTPNANRLSVLSGYGAQSGLSSSSNGKTTEVESNVGLVGGLQYQRMVSDRLSIGVQAQSNKTGSLLLGLDF